MSDGVEYSLKKVAYTYSLTEHQKFEGMAWGDSRYERRAKITHTEPTEADWAAYRAAAEGLKALEAYEHTEWGGPDYDTTVPEPPGRDEVEWLETEDEWLARCRKLWTAA